MNGRVDTYVLGFLFVLVFVNANSCDPCLLSTAVGTLGEANRLGVIPGQCSPAIDEAFGQRIPMLRMFTPRVGMSCSMQLLIAISSRYMRIYDD